MPTSRLEPRIRHPAPELGPRAQRTIEKILAATREVFLARGYAGTSIDHIAQAAGVSRSSFYTYFPTKRDALLALGSGDVKRARAVIEDLRRLGSEWTIDGLRAWAATMFAFQDEYGSFAFAWNHAAHEDPELRDAGMKTHLATCRKLGRALDELRGGGGGDPALQGLIIISMFERVWSQCRLYEPAIAVEDVAAEIATLLAGILQH